MPRSAGYSGKPLASKLGIGPGAKVVTIDAPRDYRELVSPLPEEARITSTLARGASFVHLFATSRQTLETRLEQVRKVMAEDAVLWVSWPKKTSGVTSDITEDVIRELAFPRGLVDIKVCAVSEVWSGLKLMIRKELRKPR
jgi:hypothetical protein